jgi:serine/threonine-protein kinase HipA
MLKHKLIVNRRLSCGKHIKVGELAENNSGIFFQYDDAYLHSYLSISPFSLAHINALQKGPVKPHDKLHGVFADSLPDGWGLYLMDRIFRKNQYNPSAVTPLERLSYIGNNCLGALYYEPSIALANELNDKQAFSIQELGKQAVDEFEGCETEFIERLMNAGGSGGARPKINATLLANGSYSMNRNAVGQRCIIKLTSTKFDLQHEESVVEFCCMTLANACGIETAHFELFEASKNAYWLRQDRFDCVGEKGRLHMISASGLLDASFREPSLDYVDLVKATRIMCGPDEAKKVIKRALFNYFISNQDDHAKNFAFLNDDNGNWKLSPFYDLVYSPSPYHQHMTAFNGNGSVPDKQALVLMAKHAGIAAKEPLMMAQEIIDALAQSVTLFSNIGLSKPTIKAIMTSFENKRTVFMAHNS